MPSNEITKGKQILSETAVHFQIVDIKKILQRLCTKDLFNSVKIYTNYTHQQKLRYVN